MSGLAIAVFVVLVVTGGLAATATVPNQAAVGIAEGHLLVRPLGLMRLWSLSGGVTLPLTSITDVGVLDRRSTGRFWRPNGMRLPGAYLPGVICAGTYRRKGIRELWMVARASEAVVFELHGERFTRVVVQVADPVAVVGAVRAAR